MMKKYLYLLLMACVGLCACEPETTPKKPDVAFYFGTVSVETAAKTAAITAVEPYMTVDGVKYDDAKISLRYIGNGHDLMMYVEEYRTEGDKIIFEIDDLIPNLEYSAYLIVDGGEYGKMESDEITFTTQQTHEAVVGLSCDMEVEAKGLMATVNLTNIAYSVDEEAQQIAILKVEYSRTSPEEWVAKMFNSDAIENGALVVELPFEGEDYLVESRNYKMRITLFPVNSDYEPLTSEEFGFKTDYAEVTANIATPTLELQGNYIKASVENIEVFYDGVAAEKYKYGSAVSYYFYYRVKGTSEWSKSEVSATNGNISAILPAEEENTYEVQALIAAGAMQKMRESGIAEIEVPKEDTPIPPIPPVGGGDTSSVAGTWHLTEWRGAAPSFDIYLDITADGIVTLWQRLESREWECFVSTAAIENGVIFGTYTDGAAWGASYSVTIEGDAMTWIDTNDSTDVSVYTRSELPDNMPTASTRAVVGDARFL